MYVPEHLERWKLPRYYFGQEWPEYYSAGVGRSRDSGCLEESNFRSMLKRLGGESDTVQVVRESHWAVGWVEWIAIHESDEKSLRTADGLKAKLDGYPILDEFDCSELEWEEGSRIWSEVYDWRDRVRELRRHHECQSFGELLSAARGSYSSASGVQLEVL
jgi:hypothetical protein